MLVCLGSWQVASMFVHLAALRQPWIATGRKVYHVLLSILAVGGICAGLLEAGTIEYLYCMLVAGPALGVFYLVITARELQKMKIHYSV